MSEAAKKLSYIDRYMRGESGQASVINPSMIVEGWRNGFSPTKLFVILFPDL